MKRGEARKLVNKAVAKAMGTPVEKDWVTMNGTHVYIGDDGDVQYGPSSLRGGGSGSGGKGKSDSSGKNNSKSSSNSKIKDGKIPNMSLMNKEERAELQKEVVKIQPELRKPQLKDYEYKQLGDGNRYTFANLLSEYYPDFCEEVGFDNRERQNRYKSWVDYSDGLYTVHDKDYNSYHWNTKMEFRGAEEY